MEERRHITATEAEALLGIKASRIRQWAHRGKIYPVGVGRDLQHWYKLSDVLRLAGRLS